MKQNKVDAVQSLSTKLKISAFMLLPVTKAQYVLLASSWISPSFKITARAVFIWKLCNSCSSERPKPLDLVPANAESNRLRRSIPRGCQQRGLVTQQGSGAGLTPCKPSSAGYRTRDLQPLIWDLIRSDEARL